MNDFGKTVFFRYISVQHKMEKNTIFPLFFFFVVDIQGIELRAFAQARQVL